MSRFLVGSVLFIATLAALGTGVTNTVVNWFDNLGNSASEEATDPSFASAADDLSPIQRAGSFVQSQTEPFAEGGGTRLFTPEEFAQGQGGASPEGASAPLETQSAAATGAADSSIPALW